MMPQIYINLNFLISTNIFNLINNSSQTPFCDRTSQYPLATHLIRSVYPLIPDFCEFR